jgi:hypothetical protein
MYILNFSFSNRTKLNTITIQFRFLSFLMLLIYFRMWTCAFCLFPMSPLPDTEESPDTLVLKYKNLETEIYAFLIVEGYRTFFTFY